MPGGSAPVIILPVRSRLTLFAIVLAALSVIAFFLPWLRLAPVNLPTQAMILREAVLENERTWVNDYVLMRGSEWREATRKPAEGFSGYQLAVSTETESPLGETVSLVSNLLFSSTEPSPYLKLLILGPLFSLFSIFVLLLGRPRSLLFGLAAGQILYYLGVRYKMKESLLLSLGTNAGPGFWICLYATVLAGLCTLLVALLPGGKK